MLRFTDALTQQQQLLEVSKEVNSVSIWAGCNSLLSDSFEQRDTGQRKKHRIEC